MSRAGEAERQPQDGRETIAIFDESLTLIYQRRRAPNPKCAKVDGQFPFQGGLFFKDDGWRWMTGEVLDDVG